MAVKLQTRPELLRGWIAQLTDGERVLLAPAQLRMLGEDVLAAHELRGALAELVDCKTLKARFEPMQPGSERAALLQQYMDRAGPAWDTAYEALGIPRYAGKLPAPAARVQS